MKLSGVLCPESPLAAVCNNVNKNQWGLKCSHCKSNTLTSPTSRQWWRERARVGFNITKFGKVWLAMFEGGKSEVHKKLIHYVMQQKKRKVDSICDRGTTKTSFMISFGVGVYYRLPRVVAHAPWVERTHFQLQLGYHYLFGVGHSTEQSPTVGDHK